MHGGGWAVLADDGVDQLARLVERAVDHRIADDVLVGRRQKGTFVDVRAGLAVVVAGRLCGLVVTLSILHEGQYVFQRLLRQPDELVERFSQHRLNDRRSYALGDHPGTAFGIVLKAGQGIGQQVDAVGVDGVALPLAFQAGAFIGLAQRVERLGFKQRGDFRIFIAPIGVRPIRQQVESLVRFEVECRAHLLEGQLGLGERQIDDGATLAIGQCAGVAIADDLEVVQLA
ncbi:hypothetical protein GALL_434620 [mine drainage metagenome]|uniref:Uncharacterized protein n=1 Tax=mine drainage metagenome TaxID=410659 RepID=A0A1J5PUT0_9ZZZZ